MNRQTFITPFTLWYSMKAKFEKEKGVFTEGTVQDHVDEWVKEAKIQKAKDEWKCEYCDAKGDDECIEECECGECLENHEPDCMCDGCVDNRVDYAEARRDAFD